MAGDNRGPELEAVCIFLLAFSYITVGLRCYTMGYLQRRFFAEDYLAVATLMVYTAFSVSVFLSIHYGLGQRVGDVPEEQHPKALFWKWMGMVFYVPVAAMVKFVVGLFLLHICLHKKWQRVTIWTLLGIVGVFNLFYFFVVIFQCIPVQFFWYRYTDPRVIEGKCNGRAMATIPSYISLLLNIVADWTLALLPVSFVWSAKMERKTKISVVAVLSLGSFASMATVARIPYAKQLLASPDYLYNFTDLAIWSTVEIGLALSASSLATLKPLFRKLKVFATTRHTTSVNDMSNGGKIGLHSRKLSMPFGSRNFTNISGNSSQTQIPLEPITPTNPKGIQLDTEVRTYVTHEKPQLVSPNRPSSVATTLVSPGSINSSSSPIGFAHGDLSESPRVPQASYIPGSGSDRSFSGYNPSSRSPSFRTTTPIRTQPRRNPSFPSPSLHSPSSTLNSPSSPSGYPIVVSGMPISSPIVISHPSPPIMYETPPWERRARENSNRNVNDASNMV